jgi:hypothetical protein
MTWVSTDDLGFNRNLTVVKCRKMLEMTFRKTLRMEHAIAENDRTVRGTPVGNCIFEK